MKIYRIFNLSKYVLEMLYIIVCNIIKLILNICNNYNYIIYIAYVTIITSHAGIARPWILRYVTKRCLQPLVKSKISSKQ